MFRSKTVAIIFPTYREKRSIYRSIQEFDGTGFIDEVIVVDNNAEEGTKLEVRKTRARLIIEKTQGYGAAIKTGIKNTKADLLIIAEPDGTYLGNDVLKLLSYSDDFDVVFGSRTHIPLIQRGSEMSLLRRYMDVLFGKLISLLFNCSTLTDVGCTLRLTNRKGLKILTLCRSNSPLFATEWLLQAVKNKVSFIEIPVNFRRRVGKSSTTSTFLAQAKWGILIFFYILKVRLYG